MQLFGKEKAISAGQMLQNSQKIDYELIIDYRQKFQVRGYNEHLWCIFKSYNKLRNIGLLDTTILNVIESLQTNRHGLSTICDIKLWAFISKNVHVFIEMNTLKNLLSSK